MLRYISGEQKLVLCFSLRTTTRQASLAGDHALHLSLVVVRKPTGIRTETRLLHLTKTATVLTAFLGLLSLVRLLDLNNDRHFVGAPLDT